MEYIPMIRKDISFKAGEETLAGRLFSTSSKPSKGLLFLHGAGKSTKERAEPIVEKIGSESCLNSFTFDFSGHGMSSGTLEASSLQKRVLESKAALATSGFEEPISICAFSMGGHIALELLQHINVHTLVLFYPAVYTEEVFDVPFGNPLFTTTIRKERSWENAKAFSHLRTFTGNLIVVAGEEDNIIPADVIESIMTNACLANRKRLFIIKQAPHLLLPILYDQKEVFDEVFSIVIDFLTSK